MAGAIAVSDFTNSTIVCWGGVRSEIASLTLFSLTPGEVESQAVQTLGPLAKYSSFIGATLVNIILYGLIGILVGRLYDRLPGKNYLGRAVQSTIIVYVLLLAITSVLLSLTEASAGPVSVSDVFIYLIPPDFAFGFVFPDFIKRYHSVSL